MPDLLKIKEEFSQKGILICFNGPFTHKIIEEIGNAVRHHLKNQKLNQGTITDVFAVYVEQTQNCRNYLSREDLPEDINNEAIVSIINNNGLYKVCSGSFIKKEDVAELREHIDFINKHDKNELKALYKKQLRGPSLAHFNGAGVGLIDMARRAHDKLVYKFVEKDNGYDFFSLIVTVKGV